MSTTNGISRTSQVITIIGGAAILVGGQWMLAIAPLQNAVVDLKNTSERRAERISYLEHANTELTQQLIEIETQFKQLSHISNIHIAEEHKFIQLLWQRINPNEHLPDMNYFPEVGH